jgi:hypothetical protein
MSRAGEALWTYGRKSLPQGLTEAVPRLARSMACKLRLRSESPPAFIADEALGLPGIVGAIAPRPVRSKTFSRAAYRHFEAVRRTSV